MAQWKKRVKKYKKKLLLKRFFNAKNLFLAAMIFTFLASLSYFFLFSRVFQVKKIEFRGIKDKVLETKLRKDIYQYLEANSPHFFSGPKPILKNSNYLSHPTLTHQHQNLLSTKSIFFVNTSDLENLIKNKYSTIKVVHSWKILPNTLVFQLQKKAPQAVCCLGECSHCFLLDTNGNVLRNVTSSMSKYFGLPLILFSSTTKAEISKKKQEIISTQALKSILDINKAMREIDIKIKKFVLSPTKITADVKEGWKIYFQRNPQSIPLEILKLKMVLNKLLPPQKRRNLQYIDLRFTKVYYK